MESKQVKKLIAILIMTVLLFGLESPIMAIDDPVAPFQKAKAMALLEGRRQEGGNDKTYVLLIEGWGAITYTPEDESIMLAKGTSTDNSAITYIGKYGRYSASRSMKGGKPEMTFVDWSAAMDIAYKYLREIEAVRGNR